MAKKRSVNPFGEELDDDGNVIAERNIIVRLATNSTFKTLTAVFITLCLLVVATIVIGYTHVFNSTRNVAEQSINDFNKSLLSVTEASKDPAAVEELTLMKGQKDDTVREAGEKSLEIINSLKNEDTQLINVNMTGEEAALASIRQILLCDMITKTDASVGKLNSACENLNTVGTRMMDNIQVYNLTTENFTGKIAMTDNKNKLPDMRGNSGN